MRNKGFKLRLLSSMLGFVIASSCFPFVSLADGVDNIGYSQITKMWTSLDADMIVDKIDVANLSTDAQISQTGLLLNVDQSIEFNSNIPNSGEYNIALEYKIATNKVINNSLSLSYDSAKTVIVAMPALWGDVKKSYDKDRYGNEIIADQKMIDDMHIELLKEIANIDKSPVVIQLESGNHKFQITNNTQPIYLKTIYILKKNEMKTYKQYSESLTDKSKGNGFITVEAENYIAKSDSSVRSGNTQNPILFPYDTNSKLLNVIDDWSWRDTGKKVMWEFNVEKAGLYSLGFRYTQKRYNGMPVFRNIEIDGKIPFKELAHYPFAYSGMGYANLVLSDKNNNDYKIWLDKGKHSIALESDAGTVKSIYEDLRDVMLNVNDTGMEIKKLTGGNKDINRTWNLLEYMPDITKKLLSWADRIDKAYSQLKTISGEDPTYAANLKISVNNLRELAIKPNKLPNSLTKFSEGSGCVSQLIGDFIPNLTNQPLGLDRIYITDSKNLPSADAGFFTNVLENIKAFFISFLPKSNNLAANSKDPNELSVWVNRPIQYVQLMQQIADSEFTKNSGIKVNFSVMPNEQKLILANSAGISPDVALGVTHSMPYQLAIRGAVADFMEFKDFIPYIGKEYNVANLIPYSYEGKIFGVTETQEFNVLTYRKDIFDKLKIPVPKTWEDVKSIMPELQRHSMNMFLPMAASSGIKPFNSTASFFFQNGGDIYKKDGFSTDISSEKSMKGFELMTELFNIYSVAQNAPNFYNNFRYGTMPIGILSFGTYVTLVNAAPEIEGLWNIALSPGVKDSQGNIMPYQTASDKADIIFNSSTKKDKAWSLLKWWLSKDVQVKFAYSLQARFGREYIWNTANMDAFKELPLPEKDKKVILEQWKYIKEIPPHPAAYMVEREISNAWTDVVINGLEVRASIDKAVLNSNREILKKLEEFGYYKNGKAVKDYIIPTVEDLKKKVNENK